MQPFNPIPSPQRETLRLLSERGRTRLELADQMRCSISVVRERIRAMTAKKFVTESDLVVSVTEHGMNALAHAPVIQKSGLITGSLPKRPTKVAGYEAYVPPEELHRPTGVTEDRFLAYALPSRVGNKLYFPDGRISPV